MGDPHPPDPTERRIQLRAGRSVLHGALSVPDDAAGLVIFAHGTGIGHLSRRNQMVAGALRARGMATLLVDLLTDEEEHVDQVTAALRFDIHLLANRLVEATDWLSRDSSTRNLPIGYFGAGTGAAAALVASTGRGDVVRAIVSRGGRPDLAMSYLHRVRAPTLLVVGGHDYSAIEMNREAARHLNTEKRVEIVPGATHLFDEAGALEKVAELSTSWFSSHMAQVPA